LLYLTIEEVLDITRIKIHHLKGENKWGSSRILDSNGLDMHWRAQRNELIVPGQIITFSLKRVCYKNLVEHVTMTESGHSVDF